MEGDKILYVSNINQLIVGRILKICKMNIKLWAFMIRNCEIDIYLALFKRTNYFLIQNV